MLSTQIFLLTSSLYSAGFSWAVDTTGKCLFRSSVDASSSWVVDTATTLPPTSITVGHTGEMWITTAETVPATSNIWYRATPTPNIAWTNVGGVLVNVSVGQSGKLVGVNSGGDAFFRNGINGTWIGIGVGFKQVVIGSNGIIWGIKPDTTIWIRTGITASVPQGVSWMQTDGGLSVITIGQNGAIYGIGGNYAYQRANITASNPAGTGWILMSSTPAMATISAGFTGQIWGIDTTGKYYLWTGSAWQQVIT